MMEWYDAQPDISVQESEYQRLLGFPRRYRLEDRSRELADWAGQWHAEHAKPWIYARQTEDVELTAAGLKINGLGFASPTLRNQLAQAGAHGVTLVAVSAGGQGEEHARLLWEESKPDEYFFLEVYGTALVEHLVAAAAGRLCDWASGQGLAVLPHYSPGYPGWAVSEQIQLWDLIRRSPARAVPGELRVLESGMLRPKKSLLAVFGLTRHLENVRRLENMVPCENCLLPACRFRRAPYRQFLPQFEGARQLQPVQNLQREPSFT